MELDVRHLRLIAAIADAGSISGAASAAGISQPTVSAQLRRIEEAVGEPLFDRLADGIRTTSRGAAILRRARPMLAELDGIYAAPAAPAPAADAMRIRTFVLPFEVFLPLLSRLTPTVAWNVEAGGMAAGVDAVAAREADLYAGFWWPGTRPPPGVVVHEVLRETGWVVLPAHHRLAREPVVSLRRLADETWACRPEPELHEALLRECWQAGFLPDIRFRVVDESAVMSVVGSGAAVARSSPVTRVTRSVVLRPCSDTIDHSWVLAHRRDELPPQLVRTLADMMRWAYASRAEGNEELRAALPPELRSARLPEPYAT